VLLPPQFERDFFMAKNKKSFILYCDQQGVFNKLPDEIAGKLIKHIFAYVNDENPPCDDLLLSIAFEPIKTQLKRDLVKYEDYIEKQSVNGSKGGRPKKANETQKTQAFFEEPKKADTDNVTDNDNDIENVKEEYKLSFDLWLKYKKEKKQKYTTTGIQQLIKSCQSKYTAKEFKEVVEHSISQNYSGLYEPKQDKSKKVAEFIPQLKTFKLSDYE
jgi:uncharacterized protein YlbG (UPF0298 family)